MTNNTLSPRRGWRACVSLGAVVLLLAAFCLPLGMAGNAYAASSAEERGQELAQQDPGWEAAQESYGTTQYFLEIPEPESTTVSIGKSLPKTGDAKAAGGIVLCVALAMLAGTVLAVTVIPKRDDEEERDKA